jgi:hypothetical protein
MAGFIDEAVQDIDKRLKELKQEEERLLAARAALAGAPRRGPGRPPRSAAASTTRRRPGRPRGQRGGKTRSTQALDLVRNQPGITIPEIATAMKIEPNYLYRVMPKLTSDGVVRRDGQGWFPTEKSAA